MFKQILLLVLIVAAFAAYSEACAVLGFKCNPLKRGECCGETVTCTVDNFYAPWVGTCKL